MLTASAIADGPRNGSPQHHVTSSASKALALLEMIAQAARGPIGVSDIAADLGMPKSTTHRLLKTLEDHGFVGRDGAKYRIGNRFYELSEAARWSQHGELCDVALKPMNELSERTGASVHLAVLDGRDVVFLEKVTTPSGCRFPTRTGSRLPASCTALGKAMLAFTDPDVAADVLSSPLPSVTRYSVRSPMQLLEQLRTVRRDGVAVGLEEARLGVGSIAAPVLLDRRSIAAISVNVPVGRLRECEHGRAVKATAATVSTMLRG